mmetsp:Transcript_8762/g.10894  ORF Transcript_8762/g.10894 Transcript_8762/m.10894 type:complete len:1377 (+) Transcript_8762:561-4691(+)
MFKKTKILDGFFLCEEFNCSTTTRESDTADSVSTPRHRKASHGKGFGIMNHRGNFIHEDAICEFRVPREEAEVAQRNFLDWGIPKKFHGEHELSKREIFIETEKVKNELISIAMTSDDKKVVYGIVSRTSNFCSKTFIYILDAEKQPKPNCLWQQEGILTEFMLSEDDTELALVNSTGELTVLGIYLAQKGKVIAEEKINTQACCLAFLKLYYGNLLSRPSLEESLDLDAQNVGIRRSEGSHCEVNSNVEARLFAVGGLDGTVTLVWLRPQQAVPSFEEAKSMAFPNKKLGIACDNDPPESLGHFSISQEICCGSGNAISDLALAQFDDIVLLAVAANISKVELYTVKGTHCSHSKTIDLEPMIGTVDLSSNGKFLAAGSLGNSVHFIEIQKEKNGYGLDCWEAWDWEEVSTFTTKETVRCIALSKDGKTLAIGDDSRCVSVYCTKTNAFLHSLRRKDQSKKISLSRKGRYFAVGGLDSQITVYDMQKGLSISSRIKQPKECKSVSMSQDGQRMALANGLNQVLVYCLYTASVLCQFDQPQEVRGLELSDNGKILAVAGTDYCCKLYCVERAIEMEFVFRHTAYISSFSFVHNAHCKKLAIGDWDGFVAVYSTETGTQLQSIQLTNQILSLSMSKDGETLAVAEKNKEAKVYNISKDPVDEVHSFLRESNVLLVSLSPDGRFMAMATKDDQVEILEVGLSKETFSHQKLILALRFTWDSKTLAVAGADNMVTLYSMKTLRPCLCLPHSAQVKGVALSGTGTMVAAVGNLALVYGQPVHTCTVRDRPSFDIAAALLSHHKELRVLVENHPTVVNMKHPHTEKSLLQLAVECGDEDAIEILLSSTAQIGLSKDSEQLSPVSIAVQRNNKEILRQLLLAVLEKRVSNSPGSLETLYDDKITVDDHKSKKSEGKTVFEAIGDAFPDLLLHFLAHLKEEECEQQVLGDLTEAPVRETIHLTCSKRVPFHMWEPYMKKLEQDELHSANVHYTAVKAYRIPIKDFARTIPLGKIAKYAEKTGNLQIFSKSSIVSQIISFKWGIFGRQFEKQFALYIMYVLCTYIWGILASLTQKYSYDELSNQNIGILTLVLSPFVLGGTLWYLLRELNQIREMDTTKKGISKLILIYKYFGHNFWNMMELPTFLLLLVTQLFYYLRLPCLQTSMAVAIIGLTFKVLFFLRAFGSWGIIVRTLGKITHNVGSLFVILVLITVGFTVCFMVLLPGHENFKGAWKAFISVTLLVYGDFSPLEDELNIKKEIVLIIIFECFIAFIIIAFMNVVIANMTDSYEDVRQNAELETRLEVAKIIDELEGLRGFQTYPWLHYLVPVHKELVDEEDEDLHKMEKLMEKALNARDEDLKGRMDRIEKQLHGISSMLENSICSH